MDEACLQSFKVAVLGDAFVGKTTLAIQFCNNNFPEVYDSTIEDSLRTHAVIDQQGCILNVLDTAGLERYNCLHSRWIRESDGVLLVYNTSCKLTFDRAKSFCAEITESLSGGIDLGRIDNLHSSFPSLDQSRRVRPAIIVGNRTGTSRVSQREGQGLAREFRCGFIEISAKDICDVKKPFYDMVRILRIQAQDTQQAYYLSMLQTRFMEMQMARVQQMEVRKDMYLKQAGHAVMQHNSSRYLTGRHGRGTKTSVHDLLGFLQRARLPIMAMMGQSKSRQLVEDSLGRPSSVESTSMTLEGGFISIATSESTILHRPGRTYLRLTNAMSLWPALKVLRQSLPWYRRSEEGLAATEEWWYLITTTVRTAGHNLSDYQPIEEFFTHSFRRKCEDRAWVGEFHRLRSAGYYPESIRRFIWTFFVYLCQHWVYFEGQKEWVLICAATPNNFGVELWYYLPPDSVLPLQLPWTACTNFNRCGIFLSDAERMVVSNISGWSGKRR